MPVFFHQVDSKVIVSVKSGLFHISASSYTPGMQDTLSVEYIDVVYKCMWNHLINPNYL